MVSLLRSFLTVVLLCTLGAGAVEAQTYGHDRSVRMWAEVGNSPARITLKWRTHTNTTGFQVYRKLKGGTSWGSAIANLGASALEYTDNTVSAGVSYEY